MTDHAEVPSRAWSVAKRILVAVLLGYILANTTGAAVAMALPGSKISGVVMGTLLTFVIWAAAILWVFAEPSLKKVMMWMTTAIIVTAGIAGLLYFATQG